MPELSEGINTFIESEDTTVISQNAPSGDVGISKTSGNTGIFVYSQSPYTIWFKINGVWTSHQTFTSENLVVSISFKWEAGATHVYFQTSQSGHRLFLFPKTGSILIDGTPSDDTNQIDALVLDSETSLIVFGQQSTTTTVTTGTMSTGESIVIDDGCDASVVVTELVGDYTDSLSSNLAAYYKFDDNANDSSVAANNGTVQDSGNTSYPAGKIGKSLSFESNASYVDLNNSDLLNLGSSYTIAGWVYSPSNRTYNGNANAQGSLLRPVFSNLDHLGGVWSGFFASVGPGGWINNDATFPNNNFQTWHAINLGGTTNQWVIYGSGQDSFPLDQWVHVAMTVSGSDTSNWTVNIYINGVSQTVVSRYNDVPQTWSTNPARVHFNAASSYDYPASIAGEQKIDEFAFWKRALSQAEITSLYNSGTGAALDTTYQISETVREDFTVSKTVTVTAPAGVDEANIKITIEK